MSTFYPVTHSRDKASDSLSAASSSSVTFQLDQKKLAAILDSASAQKKEREDGSRFVSRRGPQPVGHPQGGGVHHPVHRRHLAQARGQRKIHFLRHLSYPDEGGKNLSS